MLKLSHRVCNLEFITGEEGRHSEIVEWIMDDIRGEYRITVLWWRKNSEGHYVEFVGDRPFSESINKNVLWELMRFGQRVLDAEFSLTERLNG